MNRNEATSPELPAGDHGVSIREAVGGYTIAKGIEGGLDRAREAITRLLGEARAETHEAWRLLDVALAEQASPAAEDER